MFAALARVGLIVALSVSACAGATAPGQSGRLRVVATTTIVGDIVRNVAGDRAEVTVLLAPGVDPHEYEPAPADVRAVSQAAIVFANGAGLEPWLARLMDSSGSSARVLALSDGLALKTLEQEGVVEDDPHVWLDAANAIHFAARARDELIESDPANAAAYRANAGAYAADLQELDAWIQSQVEALPTDARLLVTNHDTFGYFAARYGFTVIGAVFPAGGAQASPSAQDIADLIATIRAAGVKAVFTESTLNADLASTIAQEAGVSVVGVLYTDSLGPPDSPAATYIGLMRHNVQTIVEALN
jgi:ABC-type Zn uptake system ZnuABC Zn-binding protein ZnuA